MHDSMSTRRGVWQAGYDASVNADSHRATAHDDVLTSALVQAVGSLFDDLLDRALLSDERVTSAAEAKRLASADDDLETATDRIQRIVGLGVPLIRVLGRGARVTRLPWALVASTAASMLVTVTAGVREVRILSSLVAYRLEQATGRPADPTLVKKLTLDLYLAPRRQPDASDLKLPLGRLARRWVIRGALARDSAASASKSFDAAERLDLDRILAEHAAVRTALGTRTIGH